MTIVLRFAGTQERPQMPARAKYNRRKLQARLDAETEQAFQRLLDATGLTESRLIRKLILEADQALSSIPPRKVFTKP